MENPMPRMTEASPRDFTLAVTVLARAARRLVDPIPSSSSLHVPEDGIAGQDPAQTRLIGRGHKILAERDIGHVPEGLQLHFSGDPLLRGEIGSPEPFRAQLLEPGRG